MPASFPSIRTRIVLTFLIFLCSIMIVSAQERPVAGAEAQAQPSRQELEQSTPVDIAPEPTDPTELAIRTIRNRLHNDTFAFRNPNCTPAATSRAKNDGYVA